MEGGGAKRCDFTIRDGSEIGRLSRAPTLLCFYEAQEKKKEERDGISEARARLRSRTRRKGISTQKYRDHQKGMHNRKLELYGGGRRLKQGLMSR